MAAKNIPRFYGLRIYLSTTLLFFFLIIPFLIFLAVKNAPRFVEYQRENRKETSQADSLDSQEEAFIFNDSLTGAFDIPGTIGSGEIDSIVEQAVRMGEGFADSVLRSGTGTPGLVSEDEKGEHWDLFGEKGPFARYFRLFFLLLVISYLAGLVYNIRFKRYFRRKRSGRHTDEKLHGFCKKNLLRTPVTNSLILTFPNVVLILFSIFYLLPHGQFEGELEKEMFVQFFFLNLVATLLEFLFVYYWQKHRVHIKYIEHLFSEVELRKQIFRRRGGKIRNRLLIASGMTTLLPLIVVMVYLILSLTSVKELNLETLTSEQKEILIGKWINIFNQEEVNLLEGAYSKLFYVNAIESVIMLIGIGNGIIVSIIYILLFIRWTNRDLTRPIRELLSNMRQTRTGKLENYAIVRTNDEIGELTEGYNEMTQQIHQYVENISRMNRELEGKVKERTEEILMQKEEIEAQKEEIEAQLDLTTRQRDTISRQNEQILDSIRYAERIQSAILPPLEHLADSVTEHFIYFKPRDIVSGDYYWTTRKGEKLLLAVADCTGHGVPGAFLSMLGISSMNEIVNRNESIRASQILEYLRKFVIHSLHQTGSRGETQDGIEIALCILDTRSNILEYAGANRPLYIVRKKRKNESGDRSRKENEGIRSREQNDGWRLLQLSGDRMPIGIYEQDQMPFSNQQTSLQKGDRIYLFSDGYVDQLGGGQRKTFRSRRFRQLLLEIQEESMEKQKSILADKLKEWQGEVEQIDDILVIGIKI